MDPLTIAIAGALGQGLVQVGGKLVEKGVIEPALAPATERLKQFVRSGYDAEAGDEALQNAVATALEAAGATRVRLPSEGEWECAAGGTKDDDRYAWDPPEGPATQEEKELTARANIDEAGIGGTSPVGMYPQGVSNPFGLRDVSGNVWEWTGSWYDENQRDRSLRGGSWVYSRHLARVAARGHFDPDVSYDIVGVRLVSPVGSGSS